MLVGVGIGAIIHNWISEDFIVKGLGNNNPFGVILATLAGVPMYADIFGTIPVAEALGKHLLGDKFDFYSAGTETNPQIKQDAVRLIRQLYGIDMELTQYSKTFDKIPAPDTAISMGCDVGYPFLGRAFDEIGGCSILRDRAMRCLLRESNESKTKSSYLLRENQIFFRVA